MPQNRSFAVWARILAGLFALAGLIGLTGCGGGSGAPNNPFNTPGDLAVLPNPLTAYSATPVTVTIAGGQPPYTIYSSDQTALPVSPNVVGNTVTLIANGGTGVTAATLTVRDAFAASAQTTVTINPTPLVNSLILKPDAYSASCPNAAGSANPTDTAGSSFICSGQTGSLAVKVASAIGGGIAGRLIRFDVVQGAFQINTALPGQPPSYALTYTVPTDQDGNAVVLIRALPGAAQQTAIVQATDVTTGAFVRGTFVIVPVTNANAADLVVVPTDVKITGTDNQTCSSGVASTYYVFGGSPPYTVVATFPQAVTLFPSVVQSSGAGFTVVTNGQCVDPMTIAITDSAGHTVTVTLHNVLGSNPPPTTTSPNPINVSPSSIPAMACKGGSQTIFISGGGTVATSGGNSTVTPATQFVLSTDSPALLGIAPNNPKPFDPVTLTGLAAVSGATASQVHLSIFDGSQTKTVTVTLNNCPP